MRSQPLEEASRIRGRLSWTRKQASYTTGTRKQVSHVLQNFVYLTLPQATKFEQRYCCWSCGFRQKFFCSIVAFNIPAQGKPVVGKQQNLLDAMELTPSNTQKIQVSPSKTMLENPTTLEPLQARRLFCMWMVGGSWESSAFHSKFSSVNRQVKAI